MFLHPRPSQSDRPQGSTRSWYKITAAKDKSSPAEVLLYDYIGYWGVRAEDFVKELQEIDAETILLRINSPGGDVFGGYAIYNALKNHPAKVEARVEGLAASMASVIALAGDTVTIEKLAFYMIHNPWGMCIGNAAEMREMADVLDKIGKPMSQLYADKTGLEVDEVQELMDAETWYTGEEAVEAGFADELKDSAETEEDDDPAQADARLPFDLSGYRNPPAALVTTDPAPEGSAADAEAPAEDPDPPEPEASTEDDEEGGIIDDQTPAPDPKLALLMERRVALLEDLLEQDRRNTA